MAVAPPMKEIDLSAEIKKVWGTEWAKPELEYEFSNGKKFYRRTEHAGVYETSPDFNRWD
jgi:hypothetical protein